MSVFHDHTIPCPDCGKDVVFGLCHSVNVDLREDLREQIVAGTFQRETCPNCKKEFRMDPQFSILDLGRGQWIAARPLDDMDHWKDAEATAKETYDVAFGAKAPAGAKRLGKGLRPRLVFGWPAVWEKLKIKDHGLDDVALEILKLGLIRGVDDNPLSMTSELRFVNQVDPEGEEQGPMLLFGWFDGRTGEFLAGMRVPKELYDEFANDPFNPLRVEIDSGLWVDQRRLYLASMPAA